jgi:hypothetical protein
VFERTLESKNNPSAEESIEEGKWECDQECCVLGNMLMVILNL